MEQEDKTATFPESYDIFADFDWPKPNKVDNEPNNGMQVIHLWIPKPPEQVPH